MTEVTGGARRGEARRGAAVAVAVRGFEAGSVAMPPVVDSMMDCPSITIHPSTCRYRLGVKCSPL